MKVLAKSFELTQNRSEMSREPIRKADSTNTRREAAKLEQLILSKRRDPGGAESISRYRILKSSARADG